MAFKIILSLILIHLWTLSPTILAQDSNQFIYHGFQDAKLHLDGSAKVHSNGLLQLTNYSRQLTAHAFHTVPLNFSSSSLSFSTTYVFAMYPEIPAITGHGIVFVLSPSTDFHNGVPGKFFGLFNSSSDFKPSDHIFAVELDTIQDYEFSDVDSNHAGIDINSLISNVSAPVAYYSDAENQYKNFSLVSAKPMQIWIDYNHDNMLVQVTLAPLSVPKPSKPLLSLNVNLSEIISDTMYVGFSSSTGSVSSSHYLLGWSFAQGGKEAQQIDLSKLPRLPRYGSRGRKLSVSSMILVIVISVIVVTIGLVYYVIRRKKYEEVIEDWEQEYLLQRFSFKDLYRATKGFKEKGVLGAGGFGKVYKGTLHSPKLEVAVKRVSHGSGQGMKEFVAEVACMGRLRHRNLVQLLGYCRRKGELLLVYDYMPNGSLDKYLYEDEKPNLSWRARFKIIRGVASALLYLHEEWEQVVVHRDVKASNVLLDNDMNARLGDFGLARLYDHGTNPQTTHVVGTVGYLAPELTRKGKATTSTDVYSFGVFILEVACGRSPISLQGSNQETYLIDWVSGCWKRGAIVEASDPKLGENYALTEMELVLKLGMFCCYPRPDGRPNMRQVIQFLNGDGTLPQMLPTDANAAHTTFSNQNFDSYPTSSDGNSAYVSYSSDSILKVGR